MADLSAELLTVLDAGKPVIFCSVVETRGSTPQKAGASMLVFADGTQAGTLGGGCVEAEVKRLALKSLGESAEPSIHTFQLDDDYGWDDGLICGGRMTMLVAPAGPATREYHARLSAFIRDGTGCTEAVALPDNPAGVPPGTRFLFDLGNSPVATTSNGGTLPAELIANLRPLAERPQPQARRGFAYLPHLPRVTVLIVGGGHVGQAVATLLAGLDFEVWALDDREKYVNRDRFPNAARHIVGDIGRELQELVKADIHPGVYALIITRGHNHDEEALYHLCRSRAGYVGMIGSRRKIRLIFDDLIAKGIPEETLKNVHAPLGLPIGSQTVNEIAVSICAELIARRNTGRTPRQADHP